MKAKMKESKKDINIDIKIENNLMSRNKQIMPENAPAKQNKSKGDVNYTYNPSLPPEVNAYYGIMASKKLYEPSPSPNPINLQQYFTNHPAQASAQPSAQPSANPTANAGSAPTGDSEPPPVVAHTTAPSTPAVEAMSAPAVEPMLPATPAHPATAHSTAPPTPAGNTGAHPAPITPAHTSSHPITSLTSGTPAGWTSSGAPISPVAEENTVGTQLGSNTENPDLSPEDIEALNALNTSQELADDLGDIPEENGIEVLTDQQVEKYKQIHKQKFSASMVNNRNTRIKKIINEDNNPSYRDFKPRLATINADKLGYYIKKYRPDLWQMLMDGTY